MTTGTIAGPWDEILHTACLIEREGWLAGCDRWRDARAISDRPAERS